jgi:hypothetical protein
MQTSLFVVDADLGAQPETRAVNRTFPADALVRIDGVEQLDFVLRFGSIAV